MYCALSCITASCLRKRIEYSIRVQSQSGSDTARMSLGASTYGTPRARVCVSRSTVVVSGRGSVRKDPNRGSMPLVLSAGVRHRHVDRLCVAHEVVQHPRAAVLRHSQPQPQLCRVRPARRVRSGTKRKARTRGIKRGEGGSRPEDQKMASIARKVKIAMPAQYGWAAGGGGAPMIRQSGRRTIPARAPPGASWPSSCWLSWPRARP